jgi:ABC-type amino acid transport substrate-binding protein
LTGFPSPKGASDNALRELLNQAIASVLTDRTDQAIEQKYFSYDIYGN